MLIVENKNVLLWYCSDRELLLY